MTRSDADYPASSAWYVVGVLTIAYVVSFIDRQILSLLIEPIRRDLGLSDFQMAWIGPPAFATCFLLFGLVFGRLADRVGRLRLVAVGLTVWCIMTAACAFADSAVEMFIARMGVGIGVTAAWRETFLLVGLPGLVLLPLLLMAREPARRERLNQKAQASLADTWRFLVAQRRVFVPLFFGKAVFNLIAYAHFWIVPMFERSWGWSRVRTGTLWGTTLLVSGLIGVILGGWLSDRWYRAGRRDAALRTVWLALLATLPLHALAPLMPSGELALAMFIPTLIAAGAGSSAGSTATMLVTPNEYRGQMTALSLLIASGLGQFLGPTSVAGLTDFVFEDPKALRYSLSIAVLSFSLLAFLVLSLGRRPYREAVIELETRVKST
jgi:MFS family permease